MDRNFQTNSNTSSKRLWTFWISILLIVLFINLSTLKTYSPIWIDEAMIIDYGRTFLDPQSTWSVNWNWTENRPILSLFYLGTLFQELAFRAAGFSVEGPRFLSLLGAMVAATILVAWLLTRHVGRVPAFILGLTFLLDPLFFRSYRGDRIDCWAFALCFSSCLLIRIATHERQRSNSFTPLLLTGLAGILASLAIFVWPSSLIIYPIIFSELFSLIYGYYSYSKRINKSLILMSCFILGGVLATLTLIIPISNRIDQMIMDFRWLSSFAHRTFAINSVQNFLTRLLNSFSLTLPLAIISTSVFILFFRRNKSLALATLIAFYLAVSSGIYFIRALYLLPYLILWIGEAFRVDLGRTRVIGSGLKTAILVSLLCYSLSLSLVVRPILGMTHREVKDPGILINPGILYLGEGSFKVWDSSWNFYEVGRRLSWNMVNFSWEVESDSVLNQFLNQVAPDYIIVNSIAHEERLQKLAAFENYSKVTQFNFPKNAQKASLLDKLTAPHTSNPQYGHYRAYSLYSRQ
jgi:hypothetical protein